MEKLTDLKFYCEACGKELNVKKICVYYDRHIGKEKYFLKWFCSEVKWYNQLFTKHDFFETNRNREEIFYFPG